MVPATASMPPAMMAQWLMGSQRPLFAGTAASSQVVVRHRLGK